MLKGHWFLFLVLCLYTESMLGSAKAGGDHTVFWKDKSIHAYSQPSPMLNPQEFQRHLAGDAFFERSFSSNESAILKGLGPVYNATSCITCHSRDGRGVLPVSPQGPEHWVRLTQNSGLFLRISIEDIHANKTTNQDLQEKTVQGPKAVPGFSTQLFHAGVYGLRPDHPGLGQAEVQMKFVFSEVTYPDGESVRLRKPIFRILNPYDQTIDANGKLWSRLWQEDVKISPRLGPPVFGLGLLEAIRDSDILKLAQRDLSAEGVSGRPNYVSDVQKQMAGIHPAVSLGRFGLKANTPSVLHQSLGALNGDMGVTNYAFPLESIINTPLWDAFKPLQKPSNSTELRQDWADDLVFYTQTLAVPQRRNLQDPDALEGERLFHTVGCASCHQPSFVTGQHPQIPSLSNQLIFPYTDMLLHDMGEGLADGRQDYGATGSEWKTRPLWGLGHTKTVNPRATFLHDGRAQTVEEAILWHGGEAEFSKRKFMALIKSQRQQVLHFLDSL